MKYMSACFAGVARFFLSFLLLFAGTTVYAQVPAPITGPNRVCVGATIILSDATPGGTWSSLNVSLATVDTVTGVVAGLASGTATIKYATAGGAVTTAIAVNPILPITPDATTAVCQQQHVVLTNTTAANGTWTSSNTAVATINTSSLYTANVFGASPGTTIIRYTSPAGCMIAKTIVVNPLAQISGPARICAGQINLLNSNIPGGTWSSSADAVATINGSSGEIGGVSAGNVTIKYQAPTGCITSSVVAVSPLSPITPAGQLNVCKGQSLAVNNITPGGGTWSTTNVTVATVSSSGSNAGNVYGVNTGLFAVVFHATNGCVATAQALVNPVAELHTSFGSFLCQTQPGGMYNDITGGTWTSSSPAVLAADPQSGEVFTGMAGPATIKYTLSTGCMSSSVVTVLTYSQTQPSNPVVCMGQTITLVNNLPAGGLWSIYETDTAALTIQILNPSTVRVTGRIPGNPRVVFTPAGNGCPSVTYVGVRPAAPITTYTTEFCQGGNYQLFDSITGGTWSSASAAISMPTPSWGNMVAVSPGAAIVTYTYPWGCSVTFPLTVKPKFENVPTSVNVCQNESVTITNPTPSGGTWINSFPQVATVTPLTVSSARITGILPSGLIGNVTFQPSAAYCASNSQIRVIPKAVLSGAASVCAGSTIQLSSDIMTGGTWTSASPAVATIVSNDGTIRGLAAGNAVIRFTHYYGCTTTTTITVKPLVEITPTGPVTICQGQNATLANNTPGGGMWSSNGNAINIPGSTSQPTVLLSGSVPGSSVITFTTSGGCTAFKTVVVHPTASITSPPLVCAGSAYTLSADMGGGNWSSSSDALATVNAVTGRMMARAAGNVTITCLFPGGCVNRAVINIKPLSAITGGTAGMCTGQTMALGNSTPFGGTWVSDNAAAIVQSSTTSSATIRGNSAGISVITFTTTSDGCAATRTVTVNACRMAGGDDDAKTEIATTMQELKLYPNPNNGSFTLKGYLGTSDATVQLSIMDVTGQVVYSNTVAAPGGNIDTTLYLYGKLPQGLYLLHLRHSEERKVLRFVVK